MSIYVEVRVRKGIVAKAAVWLMLAVLTTCVLSTAVISGENPWDSDHRPNQSSGSGTGTDSTSSRSTDVITTTTSGGSATSFVESDWMRVVHRLLLFVARNQADWLRQSSRSGGTR